MKEQIQQDHGLEKETLESGLRYNHRAKQLGKTVLRGHAGLDI
jgi:hypothetical protein